MEYSLIHDKKQWIKSKGYNIYTIDRSNGLFTLKLHSGIDFDIIKEFNVKYDSNGKEIERKEVEAVLQAFEYISNK